MKIKKVYFLFYILISLSLILSACSALALASPPTSTPQPTATKTLAPTKTFTPTLTPKPTRTPNLTATQRTENYNAEVQKYFDLGYLETMEGSFIRLDDFDESWAQLGWYQRWTYDNHSAQDFLMSADLKWSSAYRNADISGCGFIFAEQDNGDHYAVFLDRSQVLFAQTDYYYYTMGPTRGTGRVNFPNPADEPIEAVLTLIVTDGYAYVLVDDELVGEYTLSQSRVLDGNLGLSLLSGTNKDYGTRCEMTNIHVWMPNN